jgi:hypothetical protein
MAASQCKGCKGQIRWITTPNGKHMPVDPEHLTEWVTDEAKIEGARKISLLTSDGKVLERGYLATVLTPGSREIRGFVPHWSTCPQAHDFKRIGDGS